MSHFVEDIGNDDFTADSCLVKEGDESCDFDKSAHTSSIESAIDGGFGVNNAGNEVANFDVKDFKSKFDRF